MSIVRLALIASLAACSTTDTPPGDIPDALDGVDGSGITVSPVGTWSVSFDLITGDCSDPREPITLVVAADFKVTTTTPLRSVTKVLQVAEGAEAALDVELDSAHRTQFRFGAIRVLARASSTGEITGSGRIVWYDDNGHNACLDEVSLTGTKS